LKAEVQTVKQYIEKLPHKRKEIILKLRQIILQNLPKGFEETISYGMIGYVVPHKIYPEGYHCKPEEPLPFINIANQKNHIALYHLGLYYNEELMNWFSNEFKRIYNQKPDIGKGCIRFKNMEKIPFELIGELVKKVSVDDWIKLYEEKIKQNRRRNK
jgi:uncharacterized protein YdhG (YjbR/CyaY superfamily)